MNWKLVSICVIAAMTLVGTSMALVPSEADQDPPSDFEIIQTMDAGCSISGIDCIQIQQPSRTYDLYVLGSFESAMNVARVAFDVSTSTPINQSHNVEKGVSVVITDSWSHDNQDSIPEIIHRLVDNGASVSVFDNDIDWQRANIPIMYSDSSDITTIYKNGDSYKFFGISCGSQDTALERMLSWLDSISRNPTISIESTPSGEIGSEYESFFEFNNPSYGKAVVRTMYYKLNDVSEEDDYYAGHYHLTLEPESGSFNSGADVKSSANGTMIRYGPYTTTGTITQEVDIGFSIGTDGVAFTGGSSWSYTSQDVDVRNHTLVSENFLDIRHNIHEETAIGRTTFTCEPGKVIKIPESEGYVGTDTYSSQFCHRILDLYTQYDDLSHSVNILIPET